MIKAIKKILASMVRDFLEVIETYTTILLVIIMIIHWHRKRLLTTPPKSIKETQGRTIDTNSLRYNCSFKLIKYTVSLVYDWLQFPSNLKVWTRQWCLIKFQCMNCITWRHTKHPCTLWEDMRTQSHTSRSNTERITANQWLAQLQGL